MPDTSARIDDAALTDATIGHLRAVLESPTFENDRYELLDTLGSGGTATVFLARDRWLGRDVAIKVASASVLPLDAARALAEARIVGRLEHHGIVPIYDAGQLADGRTYCVMRRVRGTPLAEWLRTEAARDASRIDLGARLRIIEQLCEAVAFAHGAGVVHCDLSPNNMMIGDFGEVVVMDWGAAARTTGNDGARRREVGGTRGFSAPEQLDSSGVVSPRTDVYAIGRLLETCAELDSPSPPTLTLGGRPLGAGALRPLQAIVARATAFDADARYASVSAFAKDVRSFAFGDAVSAYQESMPERVGRTLRRHRVLVGLLASYLIMRAALLLWR